MDVNLIKLKNVDFIHSIDQIYICFSSKTWLHKDIKHDIETKVVFYKHATKC